MKNRLKVLRAERDWTQARLATELETILHRDFLKLMERLGIVEYWSLHACEFEDAVLSCIED